MLLTGVQVTLPELMSEKQYRQCELSKASGSQVQRHVAFIPSDKAKPGKYLKLPSPWGDGWLVDSVGPVREIEDVDQARDNLKRFQYVLGD
jgi:hypothetical protein